MAAAGWLSPGPRDDGSGEQDAWAIISPELVDVVDLAQQPDEALEAILRQIASGVPRDTAKARAARIEIDRRLVARSAAENFDGPNTSKLLMAAFEYAHPVVGYLVNTGRIFKQCKRLGRPCDRQPGDEVWTLGDRAFLTEKCLDVGIFHVFWEHGLKRGRWDSRGGAALTTYGVNACCLSFPSVYKRWWRGQVLEQSFGDPAVDLPTRVQVDQHQPDPADQVANRDEAARLLRQIPEPVRTGVWLRAIYGMTQAQAAEFIGLTEKGLEGRLRRVREQLGLAGKGPPETGSDPSLEVKTDGGEGIGR